MDGPDKGTFGSLMDGVQFVLWVAACTLAYLHLSGSWTDATTALIAPFVLIPLFWLALAIHELGHALAAKLVGWRLIAIVIGPLGYHVVNRQAVYVPFGSRAEIGGFVVAVPASAAVWTRNRDMVFASGGLMANLIAAYLLFDVEGTHRPLAEALAILSLTAGVAVLLPSGDGRGPSDGQRLLQLAGHGEQLPRDSRAVHTCYGLASTQLRLRDLPDWLVDEALEATDPEAKRWAHALLVSIALDRADIDSSEARPFLDAFRADYGGSVWLDSCDAIFAACWEHRLEHARQFLPLKPDEPHLEALALAATAAVAAAEGNGPKADHYLKAMKRALAERHLFASPTFRDIERRVRALLDPAARSAQAAQPA